MPLGADTPTLATPRLYTQNKTEGLWWNLEDKWTRKSLNKKYILIFTRLRLVFINDVIFFLKNVNECHIFFYELKVQL